MTKFDLAKSMFSLIEDYEKAGNEIMTTEAFMFWLTENAINEGKSESANLDKEKSNAFSEWRISYFVWLMSKYAKTYVKRALQNSPLVGLDDFGFLISLCYEGSKTKTELIQQNIMEVSSGMEIIKRLEKKGLIKSFRDENDKRAIRLAATAKGQSVLAEAMKEMFKASNIIAGNLDSTERVQLLSILNKLHLFHNPIFLNENKTELVEIQEKYLIV
ncbi:MAG: MarR family winged helix-turn-helix transcriptional regulator [Saprospiraceae bacterium]